jgi:predicted Zn-dependent protease with MMP-like domain
MNRADFVNVAEEALDSLPEEFRSRIKNVAILVEDFPPKQSPPQLGQQRRLLLGIFHGVPATKKSVFHLPTGPAHREDISVHIRRQQLLNAAGFFDRLRTSTTTRWICL